MQKTTGERGEEVSAEVRSQTPLSASHRQRGRYGYARHHRAVGRMVPRRVVAACGRRRMVVWAHSWSARAARRPGHSLAGRQQLGWRRRALQPSSRWSRSGRRGRQASARLQATARRRAGDRAMRAGARGRARRQEHAAGGPRAPGRTTSSAYNGLACSPQDRSALPRASLRGVCWPRSRWWR